MNNNEEEKDSGSVIKLPQIGDDSRELAGKAEVAKAFDIAPVDDDSYTDKDKAYYSHSEDN